MEAELRCAEEAAGHVATECNCGVVPGVPTAAQTTDHAHTRAVDVPK